MPQTLQCPIPPEVGFSVVPWLVFWRVLWIRIWMVFCPQSSLSLRHHPACCRVLVKMAACAACCWLSVTAPYYVLQLSLVLVICSHALLRLARGLNWSRCHHSRPWRDTLCVCLWLLAIPRFAFSNKPSCIQYGHCSGTDGSGSCVLESVKAEDDWSVDHRDRQFDT